MARGYMVGVGTRNNHDGFGDAHLGLRTQDDIRADLASRAATSPIVEVNGAPDLAEQQREAVTATLAAQVMQQTVQVEVL